MSALRWLCWLGIHWARYESCVIPPHRPVVEWHNGGLPHTRVAQWLECARCRKVLHLYPGTSAGDRTAALLLRYHARARAYYAGLLYEPIYRVEDAEGRVVYEACHYTAGGSQP